MIHLQRIKSTVNRLKTQKSLYSTTRKEGWDDKLRILFCGSDPFSIESLEALHNESKKSAQIASIDVVTKSDRRTGRGLKTVTAPPIKKAALDLELSLHQIDTFRDWTPPDINLIIAVSFGLLVPPRILNTSKYGGLNLHPSLLPDLRGAAPLQWTIMLGRQQTGVTLQTLHPKKFDEGLVLDQTREPLSVPATSTYSGLSAQLAPVGAEMLVRAIRNRSYLPPHDPVMPIHQTTDLAPKIKIQHRTMDFDLDRHALCRRSRAVGPLYALAKDANQKTVRIKFGPIDTAKDVSQHVDEIRNYSPEQARLHTQLPVGVPWAFVQRNKDVASCLNHLCINTKDGGILYISEITVEGRAPGPASQRAAQAKLFKQPQNLAGVSEYDPGSMFYRFIEPLTLT